MIRAILSDPILTIFTLIVLALFGLVLLQLPQGMPEDTSVELPRLSEHALHHDDAKVAYNFVQAFGLFCRWECPDGRTRFACGMPNHRFAVVVKEGDRVVTSFTAEQEYARSIIEGCKNPWHLAHP